MLLYPMFIHLIQVWNIRRRLLNSSYDFEKPLSMKHGNSAVYCTQSHLTKVTMQGKLIAVAYTLRTY